MLGPSSSRKWSEVPRSLCPLVGCSGSSPLLFPPKQPRDVQFSGHPHRPNCPHNPVLPVATGSSAQTKASLSPRNPSVLRDGDSLYSSAPSCPAPGANFHPFPRPRRPSEGCSHSFPRLEPSRLPSHFAGRTTAPPVDEERPSKSTATPSLTRGVACRGTRPAERFLIGSSESPSRRSFRRKRTREIRLLAFGERGSERPAVLHGCPGLSGSFASGETPKK